MISSLQNGLILHMPMDEGSFNPATYRFTDKAAYCNHGTGSGTGLGGTPSFQNDHKGYANQATPFNGSDDVITIAHSDSLNCTTYTVSAWIYKTGNSGNQLLVCKGDAGPGDTTLGLLQWDADLKYLAVFKDTNNDINYKDIAPEIPLNEWHHIGYTLDGTAKSLLGYCDGEATAYTYSLDYAPLANTDPLYIGYGQTWEYAEMYMRGLMIHNRVLSAGEIKSIYNHYNSKATFPTQHKSVFYMPLSQGSFNSATKRFTDNSAYCNHGTGNGTTLGATPSFTTDHKGVANMAVTFNGTDDYINCGNNSSVDFADEDFSISLWFKSNSESANNYILCKNYGGAGVAWYGVNMNTNAVSFFIDDGTANSSISKEANYMDNAFHHLICYRNTTQNKIGFYIDGSFLASGDESTGSISNSGDLIIGARNDLDVDRFFEGTVSDIRIFRKLLSETEITRLYYQYNPKIYI